MNAQDKEELEIEEEAIQGLSAPIAPLAAPSNGKLLSVPEKAIATQAETDADALAIAQKLFKKHDKTWTELAKY